jgi:hypothetical protein
VRGPDRHDLAVRARRRGMGPGGGVRLRRAVVRARRPGRPGPDPASGLPAALHVLMASAMIWMLTAMPTTRSR